MRAAIILCLVILILNVEVGEAGDPIFAMISKWMKENPGWLWVLKYVPFEVAAARGYGNDNPVRRETLSNPNFGSNDETHDLN